LPTEVHGNTVINKSTGYSYWTITFPQGYKLFPPQEGLPSDSPGQRVLDFARGIDKGPLLNAQEHIVFEADHGAIAMSIVLDKQAIFVAPFFDQVVTDLAAGMIIASGDKIVRQTMTIGGMRVAKVSRELSPQAVYNPIYGFPLEPRYIVFFNGYCPLYYKAQLDKDIEATIRTFTKLKNGKQ